MENLFSLSQLGWQAFFQQQLSLDEWERFEPARVISYEKTLMTVLSESGKHVINLSTKMSAMTVGDWILMNNDYSFYRLLDRLSLFSRKAAGSRVAQQLIAANIDTVFIVASLNHDFNLNRIERYLVMASEADVEPVIVLSKADQCVEPQDYVQQVYQLDALLAVETVNSLDASSVAKLHPWCREGKTVAFMGSSGVGKSTLVNTLMTDSLQETTAIRENDSKGRHTTTRRTLYLLESGGLLMDTPGMRELQLANCGQGVEETFSEIHLLAQQCKFSDCLHQQEPGCAVKSAIESGEIDQRRLSNYQKLMREQAYNSETLAEKRARDRELGRYYRSVLEESHSRKKES